MRVSRSLMFGLAATVLVASMAVAAPKISVKGMRVTYANGEWKDFCPSKDPDVAGAKRAIFSGGQKGTWTLQGNTFTWFRTTGAVRTHEIFTWQAGHYWSSRIESTGYTGDVATIAPTSAC